MKIGFFTDSYLPMHDGVATSSHTCAVELRKRGHDVYIIAPKHPKYKDKEPDVYRLTSVKFFAPEFRWALQLPQRSLLRTIQTDFDIIHGHNGGPISLLGWELSRARNIPFVLTYHTFWNKYTHYFLKGKIIRPKVLEVTTRIAGNRCDYLIAPTELVKKELVSYGIKRPIHVSPTGIDLDNFKHIPKGYLKKRLKIANDKKILLYVGRLGKEKSVDFLIHSFKLIQEQYQESVLVIVGSGSEKEQLQLLAKELGLQKNIYFLGTIKHANIPKVYSSADVFLFASQTETQGMVILESFAAGLPVVALKDDAFKGVIENGKNGFSVKKDPKLFAEKVLMLLTDKKMYKLFSDAATKTAEKFSVKETVNYLESIYDKIIKDREDNSKRRSINLEDFKNFLAKAKTQTKSFYLVLLFLRIFH